MLRFWTTRGAGRRRPRPRRPGFEAVEGRLLLSAALPPPVTAPAVPLVVTPTTPAETHRQALLARRKAARAARLAATPGTQPGVADGSSAAETVGDGGALAVKTAWKGYWMAHSTDVAKVGLNYSKLAVSHDTRKVGVAYLRAALRGDGKELDQLGHTNAVKRVGNEFTQLSHSPRVKSVGEKFAKFGRSVSDEFHKIFG